uniref:HMG box domain-containing protein n=1 Tax=Trichogramma kaykai TaxID=54128 RepID=A0ABD2WWF5_9HYME
MYNNECESDDFYRYDVEPTFSYTQQLLDGLFGGGKKEENKPCGQEPAKKENKCGESKKSEKNPCSSKPKPACKPESKAPSKCAQPAKSAPCSKPQQQQPDKCGPAKPASNNCSKSSACSKPAKNKSGCSPKPRSINPFIVFFLVMYKKSCGNQRVADVAKKAGKLWCKMSTCEKKPFRAVAERNQRLKQRHSSKKKSHGRKSRRSSSKRTAKCRR